MSVGLIVFGILSGSLINILVGLLGSGRRIGFGWSFLISLLFSPLIGLLAVLVSDPLPQGEKRWGCIAPMLVFFALAALGGLVSMLFWGSMIVL